MRFLAAVLFFTLAASAFAAPPNIVIILSDDQGYGDVSAYGATDLKTPHIDRLITSGIRLDHFYANCNVCSPTRAALLTGRYPDLVGVPGVVRTNARDNWGYLSQDAVMLPSVLKKKGYDSAIVGKWHLGLESPNTPNERGFDFFHGFLGDMMDDYYNHRRHGNNYMRRNGNTITPEGHATDLFTQWAVDYIKERKGKTKPFFLYLAYNAPHTPIQPPKEWVEKVKEREKGITDRRAKLVALIEHMDDGIGKVIDALEETGQRENTLLIFTSDNGGDIGPGGLNGPLRGGKQDMYEGGIRVCFGASWPAKIKPGSRSDQVAMTMDLFPTACEAAGISFNHKIDGVSILPTLLGEQQKIERDLVWVRREGNNRYRGQDYFAFRRGDWKLLHNNPFLPLELYNLKDDPKEENDLAAKEPRKLQELMRELMAHIQRAGSVPWQAPVKE